MFKEHTKQAIADAERELQTHLQERTQLNARRAEAEEADNKALSVAHREYVSATQAGKQARKPVAFSQHIDEVETRAQTIPVEIDKARLRVAKAQVRLVTLERAQALSSQEMPLQMRDSLDQEIAKLQEERRGWDNELSDALRKTDTLQEREGVLYSQISQLEMSVNARSRQPARVGTVMG